MNQQIKIAAPLLLATGAALAATGFADRPAPAAPPEASVATPYVQAQVQAPAPAVPAVNAPAAVNEPAAPPAPEVAPAPVVRHYAAPPVTVTQPRPSEDVLLRNAVMDRLANDARLGGRIGVTSYRHTVSLTGRVTTTAQVERAGAIARGVDGVWSVDNRLLARVGMS